MQRCGRILIRCLPVLCIVAGSGPALATGEITLLATSVAGDYGTGVDSDASWMTLRYAVGGDFQFQADVSMIRVKGCGSAVAQTGLGPMYRGGDGSPRGDGPSRAKASARPVAGHHSGATSGIGDVRLAVSRRVLGGGVKLFRVDAGVEVKIPTADETANLGTGQWDYRLALASEYRFWSASIFGGIGWNRLGDPNGVDMEDVVDAYVGVDSEPFAGGRLIATGWLEGWQPALDTAGHRAILGVGVRTTGKRRFRLQARAGLTDSSEDLALVAGVSFGVSRPGPGTRGHQR